MDNNLIRFEVNHVERDAHTAKAYLASVETTGPCDYTIATATGATEGAATWHLIVNLAARLATAEDCINRRVKTVEPLVSHGRAGGRWCVRVSGVMAEFANAYSLVSEQDAAIEACRQMAQTLVALRRLLGFE